MEGTGRGRTELGSGGAVGGPMGPGTWRTWLGQGWGASMPWPASPVPHLGSLCSLKLFCKVSSAVTCQGHQMAGR